MIRVPCGHKRPTDGCHACEFHAQLIIANPAYEKVIEWGLKRELRVLRELKKSPCKHLGPVVDSCRQCGKVNVHECALHERCVVWGERDNYRQCAKCPDRAPILNTIPDDPLPGEEITTVGWNLAQSTIQAHHAALTKLASREFEPPYMPTKRGWVLVGGGKYWPGVVLACHMIRKIGSTLPIEVWHRGEDEPVDASQVHGLNVTIKDLTKISPAPRILRGWEQKLVALTHSDFETVCYLDADAYPVAPCDDLFDLADEKGFVYWQDMHGWNDNSVKWAKVWPKFRGHVTSIQGGQLFFNRRMIWKELMIAHWLNQHSDFYYSYMYGDQDTYRVAFGVTEKPIHNLGRAPWPKNSCAFVCDYRGTPRIIHRCQGKLFRLEDIPNNQPGKYNSPCYVLPREVEVFNLFSEIIGKEKDPKLVFPAIYTKNIWDGKSGKGSSIPESRPFVKWMNRWIRDNQIKSVIDAGCGDGRVGRRLIVPQYIGCDIDRVLKEWQGYIVPAHNDRSYVSLDIYNERESIPPGDCLLVKDVLHHWPNKWVKEWLEWAIQSKRWKSIVLVYDCHRAFEGADCYVGGFRAISHALPPLKDFGPVLLKNFAHKEIVGFELTGKL